MGLDMYLSRRTYIKNWAFYKPSERWEITLKKGRKEIPLVNPSYIEEEIGYWRKANAVHAWFIKHCAAGIDNCRPVDVSRDSLKKLSDTVNKVLKNPALAPDLLPSQSGFFFGGTDYDDWYFQGLRSTLEILEIALSSSDDAEFSYRASW